MQSGKRKVLTVKLNHYEEAFNTVDEKFVKLSHALILASELGKLSYGLGKLK